MENWTKSIKFFEDLKSKKMHNFFF